MNLINTPGSRQDWGAPNSFACAICEVESSGPAASLPVPDGPPGLRVCVCRICSENWAASATFRAENRSKLTASAQRGVQQRTAEILGVDVERIRDGSLCLNTADVVFGLGPGRVEAAMYEATGMAPATICPGCEKPPEPVAGFVTAIGRVAPMCEGCALRAEDSHVFARMVWRCVGTGTTLPDAEATFTAKGMRLPTTDIEARNTAAELVRRFEADTGCKGPPLEVAVRALLGGAL